MRYFFSFVMLLSSLLVQSQNYNPVSWTYSLSDEGNSEYMLEFEATIDEGWTVYSQFISDEGPVPTSINFESEGVSKVGESEELGHRKSGMDKIFEIEVIKFLSDEPFIIRQKLKLDEGQNKIVGYLTYMTCDNEKCLPPTDVEFSFDVNNLGTNDNSQKSDIINTLSKNI